MQVKNPTLFVDYKGRQADRQRDTQTNRHTHKRTHTHIHQISLPHGTDKTFDSNEEE
jgi:hypothetical protein